MPVYTLGIIIKQLFPVFTSSKYGCNIHDITHDAHIPDIHGHCIGKEKAIVNASQYCSSMILILESVIRKYNHNTLYNIPCD